MIQIYQAKAGAWEIAVAAESPEQALACARGQEDLPFRGREGLYVWPVAGDWLYRFGGALEATAAKLATKVRRAPMVVWRHDWNRRG